MNKMSRRTLILLAAYLVTAVGLTLLVLRYQNRHPAPLEEKVQQRRQHHDILMAPGDLLSGPDDPVMES